MDVDPVRSERLKRDEESAGSIVRVGAQKELIAIAEPVSVSIAVQVVHPCAGREWAHSEMLVGPRVLDAVAIQIFRLKVRGEDGSSGIGDSERCQTIRSERALAECHVGKAGANARCLDQNKNIST